MTSSSYWDLTKTGQAPPGGRDISKPIPVLWKEKHPQTGEWIFGVPKWAAEEVLAGYACSRCLERFVTYLAACPVCGKDTDERMLVGLPESWADKIEEWKAEADSRLEKREQRAQTRR